MIFHKNVCGDGWGGGWDFWDKPVKGKIFQGSIRSKKR